MTPTASQLKQRVAAGEALLGTFLNLGSPLAAEVCGRAGFDWALVDLEHGAGTEAGLIPTLQALSATGTAALVRVEATERPRFARALDAGADGVMVPRVDSAEEAVERANATAYGLASGIITQDAERGMALAQAVDAGIVHVNDQPVGDEPQMPFGGVKDSGFGRFGGSAVVDEFTETRWITVQRGSHPFPF